MFSSPAGQERVQECGRPRQPHIIIIDTTNNAIHWVNPFIRTTTTTTTTTTDSNNTTKV